MQNNSTNNFKNNLLKVHLKNTVMLIATRQTKVSKLLIRARFYLISKSMTTPKHIGLYKYEDKRCLLHCKDL